MESNQELIIDQGIIDNIFNTDNCEYILKLHWPIEIKIKGRLLSLQNSNQIMREEFETKILEEIKEYNYLITTRVKIEIELYVKERDLYEDHLLPDIDNCLKKLIDVLQKKGKGVFIDDTQVDEISIRRIRLSHKNNGDENFIVRIFPIDENTLYAINKDEINFIRIPISFSNSDCERYYPVPQNSTKLIQKCRDLFINLNEIQNYLNEKSQEEYIKSVGMIWGTFFTKKNLDEQKVLG